MGLYGVKPRRVGYRNRQRSPRPFQRDELSVPDVMQWVHWDPSFARRSGNPATFDHGRKRETWLIHLCTDWMGDDAWLWTLDCELRRFNGVGDTRWPEQDRRHPAASPGPCAPPPSPGGVGTGASSVYNARIGSRGVRPLRHITGEVGFNEMFLDGVRVPDSLRVGEVGADWKVAGATLSGERQMVSGSGGVDRIGGSRVDRLMGLARQRSAVGLHGGWGDPQVRHALAVVCAEERVRNWTNQRVRADLRAGRSPGPESSETAVTATPDPCPTRSGRCCAAGPTPSSAAPPRSTGTSLRSGCWSSSPDPAPWQDVPLAGRLAELTVGRRETA